MTVRTSLAGRARASGFFGASGRRDHELVGGEHQLACQADPGGRRIQQVEDGAPLGLRRLLRRHRLDDVPGLRRGDQRHWLRPSRSRGNTRDSTAMPTDSYPAIFSIVGHAVGRFFVERQRPPLAVHPQAQPRQIRPADTSYRPCTRSTVKAATAASSTGASYDRK